MEVLSGGEIGQDKGDGTRADFWMLAAPDLTITRSHPRALGTNRKPDPSGQPSPRVNIISNPLCKGSDIRTIGKN
jgi:hypothetical protein